MLGGEQTICCDHLGGINLVKSQPMERSGDEATFTSGSLFITFFILAKGSGGCR